MANMIDLEIPIDKELKEAAEKIFGELGLDMMTVINIFLRQVVLEKGMPFELKLSDPSQETASAITEGRKLANDSRVKGFTNMDDLKTALEE